MTAVAAHCVSEVAQYVTVLAPASLGDSQQARRGDFAVVAAVAEADLAPLHSGAQDAFRHVVGRLHAIFFQERE